MIFVGEGSCSQVEKSDGLLYSTFGSPLSYQSEVIFSELKDDMNFKGRPTTGSLEHWARQGILLFDLSLSKSITKSQKKSDVLQNDFWRPLALEVLYEGTLIDQDMVFILIGDAARNLGAELSIQGNYRCIEVDEPSHMFLNSDDSFIGSRLFSRINNHLKSSKQATVNWSLPGCNKY